MKIEQLEGTLSKREKEILDALLKGLDWFKKRIFSSWEPIFTSRTVDELLFGYEDPLLALIHELKPDIVSNPVFAFSVSIIHAICMYLHVHHCFASLLRD